MAKRKSSVRQPRATAHDVVTQPVKELTAKTQHLIDAVTGPFRDFVSGFTAITKSRADLAPDFLRAFNAYASETGQSFVAFVRLIDPTVPTNREQYRNHAAYQAAMYLRRLLALEETKRSAKTVKASDRPVTPLQALAKLVATLLPTLDPNGVIWNAFVKDMHWSDEQAARLRRLADKIGPVVLKGRQASALRILERKAS